MVIFQCLWSLLGAFGLAALLWLAAGRLLLPVAAPARVELTGRGGGDGLEQAVKGLLWLRRSGLWRGTVVIRDGGLDPAGLALARTLAKRDGVELALAEQ